MRHRPSPGLRRLWRSWGWESAIGLLGLTLALATAASISPTADESKHVVNGVAFVETGGTLHDETPAAALHVALLEPGAVPLEPYTACVRPDAAWTSMPVAAGRRALFASRVPTALAFAVLLAVIAAWARRLFPPAVARSVLALAATEPTLLAHGSVATTDMFLTTCALGGAYALWRDRARPSWSGAAWLGLWLGAALVAKISGLFVYATLVAAFVAGGVRGDLGRRVVRAAVVATLPLAVLAAAYGLRGWLVPLRDMTVLAPLFRRLAATPLGAVPLPVPRGYVEAIDYSLFDKVQRSELRLPSFMAGHAYLGGRWVYFPFALLVKTSGPVLVLGVAGFAAALRRRGAGLGIAIGLVPLVFLAVNVISNSFDIGVRYVLPVYPFSALAAGFALLGPWRSRLAPAVAAAQVAFALAAFPNYIASFNASSWLWPKSWLLSDSNLDWGQMNHLALEDSARAAGDALPSRFCTLGPVLGAPDGTRCDLAPGRARVYLGSTVEHFDAARVFAATARRARELGDAIGVYEIRDEGDLALDFIDRWEISEPLPGLAHADPEAARALEAGATFHPALARFGRVDVGAALGLAGDAVGGQCVLARSAAEVTGALVLGTEQRAALVLDAVDAEGRERAPGGRAISRWPDTSVTMTRSARVRLVACHDAGPFVVQAAVLRAGASIAAPLGSLPEERARRPGLARCSDRFSGVFGCEPRGRDARGAPAPCAGPEGDAGLGRFVWRDLVTPDPEAAIAFYGAVLGWHTDGQRTWVGSRGPFGGVRRNLTSAGGPPAYWLATVSVSDLDATLARVREARGKVHAAPVEVPGAGRFAIVAEPSGATLALGELRTPAGLRPPPRPGEFFWSELGTPDLDASLLFYRDVLGWAEIAEDEAPAAKGGASGRASRHATFGRGDVILGGMLEAPWQAASGWVLYVQVADLDAAMARATARGARATIAAAEVPGGRLAVLVDPQGAALGLFEPR